VGFGKEERDSGQMSVMDRQETEAAVHMRLWKTEWRKGWVYENIVIEGKLKRGHGGGGAVLPQIVSTPKKGSNYNH